MWGAALTACACPHTYCCARAAFCARPLLQAAPAPGTSLSTKQVCLDVMQRTKRLRKANKHTGLEPKERAILHCDGLTAAGQHQVWLPEVLLLREPQWSTWAVCMPTIGHTSARKRRSSAPNGGAVACAASCRRDDKVEPHTCQRKNQAAHHMVLRQHSAASGRIESPCSHADATQSIRRTI